MLSYNMEVNYSSSIKLQPLKSPVSNRPCKLKVPSLYLLPRSSVAIKLQLSIFAKSITLIPPVLLCDSIFIGSVVSRIITCIVRLGKNIPSLIE